MRQCRPRARTTEAEEAGQSGELEPSASSIASFNSKASINLVSYLDLISYVAHPFSLDSGLFYISRSSTLKLASLQSPFLGYRTRLGRIRSLDMKRTHSICHPFFKKPEQQPTSNERNRATAPKCICQTRANKNFALEDNPKNVHKFKVPALCNARFEFGPLSF